jgi:ATP-dependent Lon protease
VVVPTGMILFPGVTAPVAFEGPGAKALLAAVAATEGKRLVVAARRPDESLLPIAVEAQLVRVLKRGENTAVMLVQGLHRVRLGDQVRTQPHLVMQVREAPELRATGVEAEALTLSVKELSKKLITMHPDLPDEAVHMVDSIESASQLADAAAALGDMDLDKRLELLEQTDVTARLMALVPVLKHQIEVLKVKAEIEQQVQKGIGKNQREYVLRQRLKAIQDELGEGEEAGGDELADLKKRIEEAQLPEEAAKAAKQQLGRLETMQPGNGEYQVIRTYLEWLADLPWNKETEDRIDLGAARAQLDGDHHGLDKVKKRIVEFLAVRKLAPDKKGPILCLVGPPGVGKTSLGKSVARAMLRPSEVLPTPGGPTNSRMGPFLSRRS